jgi:hypothetical protein
MAGVDGRHTVHRRALADDGGCVGDGDCDPITATDSFGDGDAASSHSHGAANQYAFATANPISNAGTGDYRADSSADATNRQRDRHAVANRERNGCPLPDRSTDPTDADFHGDCGAGCAANRCADHSPSTANRCASGDAATSSADGSACGSAAAVVALLR